MLLLVGVRRVGVAEIIIAFDEEANGGETSGGPTEDCGDAVGVG